MSGTPYFSICIPCYNRAAFVGQTIQGVLDQDFQDFEIIIADNASTDNSVEVIESFKDSRIKLIKNRYNIGFAPNLLQATRTASGRFINLLSSDDLMNPGALNTYHKIIEENAKDPNAVVIMSETYEVNEHGDIKGYVSRWKEHLAPHRTLVPEVAMLNNRKLYDEFSGFDVFTKAIQNFDTVGIFCSVVYSRGLWETVEGYNSLQHMNPDMHFILKCLKLNPQVFYVNRPLFSYRKHGGGQVGGQTSEQSIKYHLDMYNYTLQFTDEYLKGTGITQSYVKSKFIERDCLRGAAVHISDGNWLHGLRLWCFGWATYPKIMVGKLHTWLLLILLALGPIGKIIARTFRGKPKTLESVN